MKIVYMGTSEFAVPALEALIKKGEEISLVVTQPDRPKGRGKNVVAPPVKMKALEFGISIAQPESIKNNEDFIKLLRNTAPDLIVVASYGKILPLEILEIPVKGCVNIHASLLPKFRGSAPIQRAILEGEDNTGVTLMYMSEGMDEGDIIAVRSVPIAGKNAKELHDELADIGAQLLIDELDTLGEKQTRQDNSKATYAPMIVREEGHIDFKKSPEYIERLSRALSQWPGVYVYYGENKVKLFNIRPNVFDSENMSEIPAPGTILKADEAGLEVAANGGKIIVEEIQFPGKKRMALKEFLKGNVIEVGEVLK